MISGEVMNNKNNKFRWIALVMACLINLCIGSVYAWSVFANPLAASISAASGHTVTNLSIVFTIANLVAPVTMISGGYINDRLGSRWIFLIGGVMFGVGMFFSGMATSVGMLIVFYSLVAGLGMGMVYGCSVSSAIKLFPDKRGLAGGMTTASYGISSVLVSQVARWLIESTNIGTTMKVLGIAFFVIICVSGLIFAWCFNKSSDIITQKAPVQAATGKNWKEMMKTGYFWVMIIMLMAGAFSGLMITSQASPMSQNIFAITPAFAATIVSILAVFNTAGRLLSGVVSDKIGIINTLRVTFVLFIVSQILLFLSVSVGIGLFIAGICGVGICFGAIMGVYPSFTARQFGAAHNSVNYGIMFSGFSISGFLGPMVLNTVYSSTGAYNLAFIIAACLALGGLLLTLVKSKA